MQGLHQCVEICQPDLQEYIFVSTNPGYNSSCCSFTFLWVKLPTLGGHNTVLMLTSGLSTNTTRLVRGKDRVLLKIPVLVVTNAAEISPDILSGVTLTNLETLVLQCKTTIGVVMCYFFVLATPTVTQPFSQMSWTLRLKINFLATMCSEARWLPRISFYRSELQLCTSSEI